MMSSSWQGNLDIEGSGRRSWETFVCGGLCCLQHQHQPCIRKGKVLEWEPPQRATKGLSEGGMKQETCAASLGTLVLLGSFLQSWGEP